MEVDAQHPAEVAQENNNALPTDRVPRVPRLPRAAAKPSNPRGVAKRRKSRPTLSSHPTHRSQRILTLANKPHPFNTGKAGPAHPPKSVFQLKTQLNPPRGQPLHFCRTPPQIAIGRDHVLPIEMANPPSTNSSDHSARPTPKRYHSLPTQSRRIFLTRPVLVLLHRPPQQSEHVQHPRCPPFAHLLT